MERVREGIATVHFYDLRASSAALDAVCDQHMQHQHRLRIHYNHNSYFIAPPSPPPAPGLIAGRAVWAQFTNPATNAFPDGYNQGTIVIFNLDPNVSAPTLTEIFHTFGPVKELRETPMKRQQRFVEFYDVRDASRALAEMNGKEINGRSVMIEFSRPGGHCHKKHQQLNLSPSFPPPPTLPPPSPTRPYASRHRRTSPRQRVISASNRRRKESVEAAAAAMSRLTLREDDRERKGSNNNGNCSSSGKQQLAKGVKLPWKGRHRNFEPRFLIKEDAIMEASASGKDNRTTVMIKNIPNKYSQKLVLNMLDNHCIHCNEQIAGSGADQPLSSYDFVYLPIDFKCNVGYGFVNMTTPEATLRLYKAFHHQHWEVFNSRKICEVTYARVQGLEALKEHFKNSKFACENDEYLPVVFSPPRDGRQLTAPLPIVLTSHPDHHDDDDDVDDGDLTSASTTPTTVIPSSSDFHLDDEGDHHHDHINAFNVISAEGSSNGGGDMINFDGDGCSNSSRCSSMSRSCS